MKKQIPILAVVALFLVFGAGKLSSNDDANTYTSETCKFKVKRPDSKWAFSENPGPDGKSVIVSVASADLKASVRIHTAALTAGVTTESYRDTKFDQLLKDAKYSNLKKELGKIAGQKSPGLSLEAKAADGSQVWLCQYYLVNGEMFYVLQCTALKQDIRTLAPVFSRILQSFEFVSTEKAKPTTLEALAARCGSEVKCYTDWEAASKAAQKERKLILVTLQFYQGFSFQSFDLAALGPFSDPDLVELTQERFIVLKHAKNADAPFRSECLYGMGPSSFGKAVLFVTPDGRVAGDAFSFEPHYLYDYARDVLAKHPEFPGTPPSKKGGRLEQAKALLRRGELVKAREIIENLKTAEGYMLKASLYRRLRKGEEALKAIEAARQKKNSSIIADLTVDEAVIYLRTGRYKKAIARLSEVVKKHGKSERIPEAMYWLGACVRILTEEAGEDEWWRKLVDNHPESPWAWKAAVGLIIAGTKGLSTGSITWPDNAVIDTVKDKKYEAYDTADVKKAQEEALAFLLKAQRADGSWITPYELGQLSDEGKLLRDGTVALCGKSLLAYREKPKTAAAAAKAVAFLLKSHEARKNGKAREYYMDYKVWSHSCMLMFFADCLEAGIGDKRVLSTTMTELIKEMQEDQRPSGGWSYYISSSLGQGASKDNRSISFTTAAVTLGLLAAKASRVPVPDEMLRKALDTLEKMKNPNGSFTYFYSHAGAAGKDSNLPGSAGRVPLCELTLYRGKKGSLDRLRRGLDIFLRYRHELAGQRGKALMHTGRHGQGSHYLMFDYANAAAAVRELPAGERRKYRDTILELVLGARTAEGSYLGSPLLGHCYATSMALLAFRDLEE